MRVGVNPNRTQTTDYRPARVTVCVLVSVPHQTGYYAHRFDAVKLCLSSIVKHTNQGSYELLVFDNGSCSEVVNFLGRLCDEGRIQYLMRSRRNIGKANAYRMMFHAAPGEVVAYSDDDILFYPGWLEAQLRILDSFPRTGMVSGIPVRQEFRDCDTNAIAAYVAAVPEISVKRGHFIPNEWAREFAVSFGKDPSRCDTTPDYEEVILNHHGVSAYATAVHFQYVAPKAVILQALSTNFESRLMREPVRAVDQRIEALGYARLSTTSRYVRHIGNLVSPELTPDLQTLGLADHATLWTPPRPVARRFARRSSLVLQRLRNWHYFARNYDRPR